MVIRTRPQVSPTAHRPAERPKNQSRTAPPSIDAPASSAETKATARLDKSELLSVAVCLMIAVFLRVPPVAVGRMLVCLRAAKED